MAFTRALSFSCFILILILTHLQNWTFFYFIYRTEWKPVDGRMLDSVQRGSSGALTDTSASIWGITYIGRDRKPS